MIKDGQRLVSVKNEFDRDVQFYDDGFGPLWLFGDSMGVTAVVRAQTFEDAHGICEDEFYQEADVATWPELMRECDYVGDPEGLIDDAIFQENYGFRPNGRNARDQHGHGVYQKDLNGDWLVLMEQGVADNHRLTVVVESEGDESCRVCRISIATGELCWTCAQKQKPVDLEGAGGWAVQDR